MYNVYLFTRAPRERFADRDRNMINRGDGDADSENINGRRSNSVGGLGGIGGTKYPDSQQVFVGNLPTNVTEGELKTFFESKDLFHPFFSHL